MTTTRRPKLLRKPIRAFIASFVMIAVSITLIAVAADAHVTGKTVHVGVVSHHQPNPLAHMAASGWVGVCPIYANNIWYGSAGYAHADGQVGACPNFNQLPMDLTVCVQDSTGGWHDQSCVNSGKVIVFKMTAEASYYANCGHWKRTRTSATVWWLNPVTWTSASGTVYSAANYRC